LLSSEDIKRRIEESRKTLREGLLNLSMDRENRIKQSLDKLFQSLRDIALVAPRSREEQIRQAASDAGELRRGLEELLRQAEALSRSNQGRQEPPKEPDRQPQHRIAEQPNCALQNAAREPLLVAPNERDQDQIPTEDPRGRAQAERQRERWGKSDQAGREERSRCAGPGRDHRWVERADQEPQREAAHSRSAVFLDGHMVAPDRAHASEGPDSQSGPPVSRPPTPPGHPPIHASRAAWASSTRTSRTGSRRSSATARSWPRRPATRAPRSSSPPRAGGTQGGKLC